MKINFFWNDKEIRVVYVDNPETLSKVFSVLPDTLALDTETGGLDPNRDPLRLIQIGTAQNIVIIDCSKFDARDQLIEFLPNKTLVAHDAIFDYKFIYRYLNYPIPLQCTLIMNRLIEHARTFEDKGNSTLAFLAKKYLKVELPKGVRVTDWMNPTLTWEQLEYAAFDVSVTYQIYQKLLPYLNAYNISNTYDLMCKVQYPIAMAELRGIRFNVEAHKKLYQNWAKELYESRKCLGAIIGDEYITPHKLANYLENTLPDDILNIWPKTPTGKLKTDAHAFSEFSDLKEVEPITVWSKYNKLVSTYGESFTKYVKDSRIHCSFNIAGARTGRLSCQSPNMQNCIRDPEFRSLFVASEGYKLIVADYSQIEVRVAAEISKDPEMLKAYREGLDIYVYTASKIFSVPMDKVTTHQRTLSKACFSGDTEILTDTGFKKFEDIVGTSIRVAQYSLPTGVQYNDIGRRISSRFSRRITKPKFNGLGGTISFVETIPFKIKNKPLLELDDQNINIRCTPDHNIIHLDNYGNILKQPAETIVSMRSTISAGFMNKTPIESEEFSRFLAMFVADGSYSGKSLRFGFVKRRKIKRCRKICDDLGIEITQKTFKNRQTSTGLVTNMVIKDVELVNRLLLYCTKEKDLTDLVITHINHRAYLEEAQFWDSYVDRGEKEDRLRVSFFCTRERTVDIMQMMCVTEGIKSNKYKTTKSNSKWADSYTLSYWLQPSCTTSCRKKFIPLPGLHDVYCVEVPSGAIVIRRNGKVSIQGNCTLGLMYGLGAEGFVHYVKKGSGLILSLEESQELINAFRETYHVYRAWQLKQAEKAKETFTTRTMMGKLRRLDPENTYGPSMNTPIQGTAGEIMSLALIYLYSGIQNKNAHILLTVHDEIMLESKEDMANEIASILEDSMEAAYLTIFPEGVTNNLVKAHIGDTWAEAK